MSELDRTAQTDQWLILTDYASKYKISVSTLRRRIKADQIRHRFDAGRYLIFDEPPTDTVASPVTSNFAPTATPQSIEAEGKLKEFAQGEEPIISTATRLLNELKRAYTNILQEKEEQMIQLKEEVSDLKTLVRVLENDNDRMRNILQTWGNS